MGRFAGATLGKGDGKAGRTDQTRGVVVSRQCATTWASVTGSTSARLPAQPNRMSFCAQPGPCNRDEDTTPTTKAKLVSRSGGGEVGMEEMDVGKRRLLELPKVRHPTSRRPRWYRSPGSSSSRSGTAAETLRSHLAACRDVSGPAPSAPKKSLYRAPKGTTEGLSQGHVLVFGA